MSDPLRDLPTSFEEYVGQEELKRRLKVYVQEAISTNQALPHALLVTSAGQGKTALVHVIAHELQDPLVILPDVGSIKSMGQLVSWFRRFRGGICFMDEAHRCKKETLDLFLTALEEGYLPMPGGGRLQIPPFTMIAATTNPEKLPEAFVSRFPLRPDSGLNFAPYTDEEATEIILRMGARAGLRLPLRVAEGLGKAAAGTPRIARDLVMAYRALSLETPASLEGVLDLVGIDGDGLGDKHMKYLRVLERLDGVAGEKPLINLLRTSAPELAQIEAVLFRQDFMTFTPRGRVLTGKGFERIAGDQPIDVSLSRLGNQSEAIYE